MKKKNYCIKDTKLISEMIKSEQGNEMTKFAGGRNNTM